MKSAAGMQSKKWNLRSINPLADEFASKLRIPGFLAQVLLNRELDTPTIAEKFLNPKLSDLIEPEKMPGVPKAVERVAKAITSKEKIAIYGDYDVDGITSTAILWHLLRMVNANAEYYIPHRIDEGYGLNADAIRQIAENGTDLLITVDCGINANDEIALARELGMDVIVTDHHQLPDELPAATAIAHPLLDGDYPNPDSAGAMVAFKLAWAIVNKAKPTAQTPPKLRQFLLNATTLAAMGTIADVVDLRNENRILTSYGLKALPDSKLTGIRALIESADLTGETLDSYHIAFLLAPMLNAAGRMGHARLAVELLTSDNEMDCFQTARYLKEQNKLRQKCQRDIFTQAKEMIGHAKLNHPDRKTIVLAKEEWHTGVIGIVASKVVDRYYRPCIMLNADGEFAQGSARSIEGFDLYAALQACSEHLETYGGHTMAAGLKLKKENIAAFTQAFEDYARENIHPDKLVSMLDIDALCPISEFTESSVGHLRRLEPFGQGNPKPVFATKAVHCISPPRRVGAKGDHLQIAISDNTSAVRCIGFGMGKLEKKLVESDCFHVAYEPQLNTWNGNTSVQFVLKDISFE
ncbi:Single-stranded-DNA-specific exonuclease RecJ [Anaerohalosphaera lusitana]|uniref:Single-stranded-DNA-specific exonuclease RecJ n=1 Tax=Anaerohalosphaera lusitana TaxID=1936003 RepID=A0A1U9NI35_9BACT|nr:single-stranded-DNA-specific exonuclease RecJ [Anaerohalosphaera lusitana]AQT67602.1 Single-stranded-DNA-specific exonuclease RecJ [Anaerohalosphaera lusitana]